MQLENIDNEDGGTCNVNGPNGSSNGSAFIEAILFDFFISVNSSKIINPSNTSPNFNYDSIGTYTISLIAGNSYGCEDTNYQTFNVYQQPQAIFDL